MRRDGATFYAEWHGTAFTYQGRPCLLGIVRDVSHRVQAEQLLHQRVETRTHEQARLLEISLTLASTLEFQPGLILDQLREIIEYTHGGLFALEDINPGHPGDARDAAIGAIRAGPHPTCMARKPWPRCSTGTGPSASPMYGVTTRKHNFCVRFLRMGPLSCWKGCSRGCGYRWQ